VNLTVLTGLGSEVLWVDPLIDHCRARIDDAREFALAHRVVLIETRRGSGVDLEVRS